MSVAPAAEAPEAETPNVAEGVVTRSTLLSLQVMRGLAALAVAVYHTHLILAEPVYGSIEAFGTVASRGWVGVNFFFVLSGFIILYAHAGDIGRPARAGRYLWRRFSRVYPLYWLVLTGFIAAAARGIGHAEFSWAPINLISSYLLLRIVAAPDLPLQVAWTLVYEMTFYLAFLVLILNRKLGAALITLWVTAIVINGVILGDTQMPWTHCWNLYFLFGGLAFTAFSRLGSARAGATIGAVGLILLAILFATGSVDPRLADGQSKPMLLLTLALGFALVLLGAVIWERARPLRIPSWLLLLGEASYSIYLVHSPAISLFAGLNHRFLQGKLPAPIVSLTTMTIAVSAGIAVHLICEKPLLRALRKWEPARTRNVVVASGLPS